MRILLSKGQACDPPSKVGPCGATLSPPTFLTSPSAPRSSPPQSLQPRPGRCVWDGRPRCLRPDPHHPGSHTPGASGAAGEKDRSKTER